MALDSIVLYTEEIDDLQETAAELFSQAAEFPLKKNTLAIIYAEEEVDYPELYRLLSERWDFPVVGCTAMAMLLNKMGFCSMGVSVLLMTADDVYFAAGMIENLTRETYRSDIKALYTEMRKTLPSKEKMVLVYSSFVINEDDLGGDEAMKGIEDACGGDVPIFGGLASDSFSYVNTRVFCNDRLAKKGEVLVMVAGDIDLKYISVNSIENRSNFSYDVTVAERNQVYRLGDCSFYEALKREDMAVEKEQVFGDYLLTPFVLTITCDDGNTFEVARTLSILDRDKGAGTFLGSVPEDSVLSIGLISLPDVQKSVAQAFDRIFSELGGDKAGHRTLLCFSCAARYLAMASNTDAEMAVCRGRLPDNMSFFGMYAYGEYCPLKGSKDGDMHNFFHNFTFTIVAL